ncbi:MAG: hypothetical protein K6F84_08695 [Lachnospiraceae bacterium]|nr:hypothetical protein [Lachnospiraceae bacterium]
MVKVIGVRFRTAGKIYFFDPLEFEIKKGDHVIVETARGVEYGTVVTPCREVEEDKVVQPLKPVTRMATEEDTQKEAENKIKEKEAFKICLEKIKDHGLLMKLIDAEYTFDNNKVVFYFTADGRIDFRELVKDLAAVFRTRIELRQIGVRDETKMLGGIGICGRPLCCSSYLSDFIPVSIKMAKEQNLSLNPTKISGACGRLMCCLKNEEDVYEEYNRKLPGMGDRVETPEGVEGEVVGVNVLRQLVRVLVEENDEKEIHEYDASTLKFRKRKNRKEEFTKEELEEIKALELLEKEDASEGIEGDNNSESRRERRERPDRGDRFEKGDRPERGERPDKKDRPKGDRPRNNDSERKNDRPHKKDRQNRPGKNMNNESEYMDTGFGADSGVSREDREFRGDREPGGDRERNDRDRNDRENRSDRERNDRDRSDRDHGDREPRGDREPGRDREFKGDRRNRRHNHRPNNQKAPRERKDEGQS